MQQAAMSTMSTSTVMHAARAPSSTSLRATLLPLRTSRRSASRVVRVQAAINTGSQNKDGFVEFANSIGLPTDEGIFGFRPFAENWVGRLAMMGFITSIVEEAITGKGTLQQIGFNTPDINLMWTIVGLASAATLAGTAKTLNDARAGKLTRRDLARYRNFLGMKDEAANIKASQAAMKLQGDFTSPDNLNAVAAAKAAGTPADAFLAADNMAAVERTAQALKDGDKVFGFDDAAAAQAEAEAMKARAASPSAAGTSLPLAAGPEIRESLSAVTDDMAYAKDIELRNGRWAMLGFLAAVAVEAGTGKGIIMQLIMYLKWSGILGPMSGF